MSTRNRLHSAILSRTARATAGRLSWGLADQAVSSLTNFAVGIVVARSLGGPIEVEKRLSIGTKL